MEDLYLAEKYVGSGSGGAVAFVRRIALALAARFYQPQ